MGEAKEDSPDGREIKSSKKERELLEKEEDSTITVVLCFLFSAILLQFLIGFIHSFTQLPYEVNLRRPTGHATYLIGILISGILMPCLYVLFSQWLINHNIRTDHRIKFSYYSHLIYILITSMLRMPTFTLIGSRWNRYVNISSSLVVKHRHFTEGIVNGLLSGSIHDESLVSAFKHAAIMLLISFIFYYLSMTFGQLGRFTPLSLSSIYAPGEFLELHSQISAFNGSPIKHAYTGAVITCIESEDGEQGCKKGEILCEIDNSCGMCNCTKTDVWGTFKIGLNVPIKAGKYELIVKACDVSLKCASVSDSFSIK